MGRELPSLSPLPRPLLAVMSAGRLRGGGRLPRQPAPIRSMDIVSRRSDRIIASRRMLAGLLATFAGAATRRTARAQDVDSCAAFCQTLPAGRLRGDCVSAAAHGEGLCFECGPAAPAGTGLELCGTGCVDPSSDPAHCGTCGNSCGGGTTCCAGDCVDLQTDANHCGECGNGRGNGGCTDGSCCPSGSEPCGGDCCPTGFCLNDTCVGGCGLGAVGCNPGRLLCICFETMEGPGVCTPGSGAVCRGTEPCEHSSDCDEGTYCAVTQCNGVIGGRCVPLTGCEECQEDGICRLPQ
jgi:hypothetical protein